MEKSTITSKGQLTIPKRVRDQFGLRPGDRVLFEINDDEIRLRPLKRQSVGELFERLEGSNVSYPGRAAERAAARSHVAKLLTEE